MTNTVLIEDLKNVLADSYALYLKTQNYHWNVEGPNFVTLHTLFEQQYTDLVAAIDEIAELIRGLGSKAPGTFKQYSSLTSINDGDENNDAKSMIKDLSDDQDKIALTLNKALKTAQDEDDEVIAGALIDRLTVHRKNKWMLDSSL